MSIFSRIFNTKPAPPLPQVPKEKPPKTGIIIEYNKGDKISYLIPKGEFLGSGRRGKTYSHQYNPSLAIRRTQYDHQIYLAGEINEFRIGSSLDHRNLVKSHTLFIKHYPNNTASNKMVAKLIMDKVDGDTMFSLWLGKGIKSPKSPYISLPMQGLSPEDLFRQVHECALYLFTQGFVWRDVNAGNMIITHDRRTLRFFDFESWTKTYDPGVRARDLILETNKVLLSILMATRSMSHEEAGDIVFGDTLRGEPRQDFCDRHLCLLPVEEVKKLLIEEFKGHTAALENFLAHKKDTEREAALSEALVPSFKKSGCIVD